MSTLKVNNLQDLGAVAVVTNGVVNASALPAGSILQVQSVLKTDTWSASVTTGANTSVTDLSISMAVSNASNKLLILANFGVAGTTANDGRIGIAVADGGTLIGIGDAAGSRTSLATGGITHNSPANYTIVYPSTQFIYTPGDTASHTYTVEAVNCETSTRTLYVNRSAVDTDSASLTRGASSLTIMEIAV